MDDPESSEPFVFEIHTNHNVLPPSEEEEHGKVRIGPNILQFIVDQNEVDKLNAWCIFISHEMRSVCGDIASTTHRTTGSSG